eukprot:1987912-Rhodomonas_salina.1
MARACAVLMCRMVAPGGRIDADYCTVGSAPLIADGKSGSDAAYRYRMLVLTKCTSMCRRLRTRYGKSSTDIVYGAMGSPVLT